MKTLIATLLIFTWSSIALSASPYDGQRYDTVRAKFIELGYYPEASENTICKETADDRCLIYPEIVDCSGSGKGFCIMRWATGPRWDNDRAFIKVVTWGDPLAFVKEVTSE